MNSSTRGKSERGASLSERGSTRGARGGYRGNRGQGRGTTRMGYKGRGGHNNGFGSRDIQLLSKKFLDSDFCHNYLHTPVVLH